MKTSKEIQLKIIDKMRENIVDGNQLLTGIEHYNEGFGEWHESGTITQYSFELYELRVKPETIAINGVDIPKPLEYEDIASDPEKIYYVVSCCGRNYIATIGALCIDQGYHFVYNTVREAITASRKLFGMTKQ